MNFPGTTGESSCKRQENGDGTIEPDRPLKKARFAWQVKGKYHLRNENSESKPSSTPKEIDKPSSSAENNNQHNLVGNTEQNLEILGDYLLKQDFNTLESVSDSNKILPPRASSDKIPYPRYISSLESSSNRGTRSSSDDDNLEAPVSLMHTNNFLEDQCIARWQARQMAKCFVDNTINRVLDNWMIAPLPTDMDNNRFLALDVAEFINNLPGDNTIENEGILMAISAHGLQNTSSTNSTNDIGQKASNSNKDATNSPSSSSLQSDDESPATSNSAKNNEPSASDLDMSWSFQEESKQSDTNDLISFFPAKSSTYKYYGDSDPSVIECDGDETLNCNDDMGNYDFLDAAVTFAIQNKGLTSFGTDYG